MTSKLSRRALLAAGAAIAATGPVRARQVSGAPAAATNRLRAGGSHPPNLPIREYLAAEARRITDNALSDLTTAAHFTSRIGDRRRQFLEMMGLGDLPAAGQRGPVAYEVTGVIERPTFRIEKLYYESLPNLYVTANLYLPLAGAINRRRPAMLYVCGHVPQQKFHYQAHARRFAELGFPTLIAETVQLGEAAGFHHGCYREGWFHWYSRGYSPAAIELLNGIRGLDLLAARPDVDPERLGVTGISGGGATTWSIAAADERVRACSPVCGTATLESHVYDRVVDGHCDCMWWINTGLWDLADVGALIAPRPLLIASANQDGIFPLDSIRKVHAQLERLYRTLGSADRIRLVETPGGHSYHARSRTAIFSWFLEHLMDTQIPPSEVGDVELDQRRLESEAALKVYAAGPPPGNRAVTIQDELIGLAPPPVIASKADLGRVRRRIADALLTSTFRHFPRDPPPLDVEEEYFLDGGVGTRFAFTSEAGWRLHGTRRNPGDVQGPVPVIVVLKSPGEARSDSDNFIAPLRSPWIKAVVDPRGTGDTSWGDDLNWHVRRASAWTGRTIASMRVWDTLRALQAVRTLPGVDPAHVSLAARGEMAAVALYAALIDGAIDALLLESPPATQNAASQKDGKGPAIEMLSCLRLTDLPYVAGLLYPAQLVVSGEFPATFTWGSDLYERLGPPGRFTRVRAIADWTPRS